MKFVKHLILYVGLLVIFGGLIFYLLRTGESSDHSMIRISKVPDDGSSGGGVLSGLFQANLREALPRLLLQIIVIIAITQLPALMNRRGLKELIVYNIGYDMGILSAEIFFHDGVDDPAGNHDDEPGAGLGREAKKLNLIFRNETQLKFHEDQ